MARRKTHGEFIKEVEEKFKGEYEVLGKYKKSNVKIEFRHNNSTCNSHVFYKTPNSFLTGSRCPVCGMKRKADKKRKTHKQFLKEVEELVGNEFTVIGRYTSSHVKIKIRHNECNTTREVMPYTFLANKGSCLTCKNDRISKSLSLTQKEFEDRLSTELQDEFSTKDKYKNINTALTFKHNVCKRLFKTTPKSLFKYKSCRICMIELQTKLQTKTHESFVEEVYTLVGDEYTVLGNYELAKSPVLMVHNTCEREFSYIPKTFLNENRRCPYCSNMWVYTTEIFQERIDIIHNREYELMDEYINQNTPRRFKHLVCGNIWETQPQNLIDGCGCPVCNTFSKGEAKVRSYLDSISISFKEQEKFDECKNMYRLPFDFAVFNKHSSLILLIEYDGEHHYRPVNFGGISDERALENHLSTKHNDSIKDKYCIDNNIPLLRIPYWDFDNIEAILKKELHKHDLLKNNKVLEVV